MNYEINARELRRRIGVGCDCMWVSYRAGALIKHITGERYVYDDIPHFLVGDKFNLFELRKAAQDKTRLMMLVDLTFFDGIDQEWISLDECIDRLIRNGRPVGTFTP